MRSSQSYLKAIGSSVVFSFLVSLVLAAPVVKQDLISVKLVETGNGVVEATISNTGSSNVSLLKLGSILDDKVETRKTTITKDGTAVPFTGVYINYHLQDLKSSDFVTVLAGGSIKKEIDLALTHDLSEGGTYNVATGGLLRLAKPDSTELSSDSAIFASNEVAISVDGAKVGQPALRKRASIQSGCSSSQLSQLTQAVTDALSLSNLAANAAASGDASKFYEYYRTTDQSVRTTVSNRFKGAAAALQTSSSSVRIYCTDLVNECSRATAYTVVETNQIVFCNYYWSYPAVASTCHEASRAQIALHEFTHAPASYSPGTVDNAYYYPDVTKLSTAKAVLNADSYALYANAIYLNC